MTIVAQCTNCGKKYKVAETAIGKQVRCQACQTTFTVAQPATVGAAAAGGQKRVGQPAERSELSSSQSGKQQALARKYGLKPLPTNENSIFPNVPFQRGGGQADPLANHVVYDPGFSTVSVADYTATQLPKEQSMHDYMAEIEKEEGWAEKQKKSDMDPKALYLLMGVAPVVLGLIGGIAALVGYPAVGWWIFVVGDGILGFLMNAVIWQAIYDNDDSTQAFLCWFFPPYYLYYVITNWHAMMHPFLASLLLVFAIFISFITWFAMTLVGMSLHGPPEEVLRMVPEVQHVMALWFA